MDEGPHHLELIPLRDGQHKITLLPRKATDLPFFYLTKQKQQLTRPIEFEGIDQAGRPMRWVVTPNPSANIGAPAIDAHETWVRLVVPQMTIRRSPDGKIPSIVPLGRVRECLRTIGWTEGGFEARRMLRALRQIGAAWCVADLWIPSADVDAEGNPVLVHVKGEYSRMAIYAIGNKHLTDEQLRDGNFQFDFDLEDTVYIQLHPLEVSMQQSQPPRLVDNQYMFSVGPAARRWYELVAPKIYGALKHKKEYCEIRYSWYVRHHHTLQRQTARKRVVFQMNRVAADHLRSGYVSRVEYRAVKQPGEEIDYLIRYFPGPEAKASVARITGAVTHRKRSRPEAAAMYSDAELTAVEARFVEEPPVRKPRGVSQEGSEHPLRGELIRRGIVPAQAEKLLANLTPDQAVADQLEWADAMVSQGGIDNPPGFYVYVIRNNVAVPDSFVTAGKRKLAEELHVQREKAEQEHAALKQAYERYQNAEIDRYIAARPDECERLTAERGKQLLQSFGGKLRTDMLELMLKGVVRAAIRQRVVFMNFEEFCRQEHGQDTAPESKSTADAKPEAKADPAQTTAGVQPEPGKTARPTGAGSEPTGPTAPPPSGSEGQDPEKRGSATGLVV